MLMMAAARAAQRLERKPRDAVRAAVVVETSHAPETPAPRSRRRRRWLLVLGRQALPARRRARGDRDGRAGTAASSAAAPRRSKPAYAPRRRARPCCTPTRSRPSTTARGRAARARSRSAPRAGRGIARRRRCWPASLPAPPKAATMSPLLEKTSRPAARPPVERRLRVELIDVALSDVPGARRVRRAARLQRAVALHVVRQGREGADRARLCAAPDAQSAAAARAPGDPGVGHEAGGGAVGIWPEGAHPAAIVNEVRGRRFDA